MWGWDFWTLMIRTAELELWRRTRPFCRAGLSGLSRSAPQGLGHGRPHRLGERAALSHVRFGRHF